MDESSPLTPARIEQLSLQAWPGLTSEWIDGWLLRTAGGYTKRANSATPLAAGRLPLSEKIDAVEAYYEERGLRPIVRIPSFVPEADRIDDALAGRGWRRLDETSVQAIDLLRAAHRPAPFGALLPLDLWLPLYYRYQNSEFHPLHRKILESAAGELLPVWGRTGPAGAVGLGVVEDGVMGIFDVVSDPAHRRQGSGEAVMRILFEFGLEEGAHQAYLQVMVSNAAALALYRKLGFEEQYRYAYRVKE